MVVIGVCVAFFLLFFLVPCIQVRTKIILVALRADEFHLKSISAKLWVVRNSSHNASFSHLWLRIVLELNYANLYFISFQ